MAEKKYGPLASAIAKFTIRSVWLALSRLNRAIEDDDPTVPDELKGFSITDVQFADLKQTEAHEMMHDYARHGGTALRLEDVLLTESFDPRSCPTNPGGPCEDLFMVDRTLDVVLYLLERDLFQLLLDWHLTNEIPEVADRVAGKQRRIHEMLLN